MPRNAQLFFAALLAGSGASPLAAQSASEVSIDRIEWFSGGACTIYLTLKNSGAGTISVTGEVVMQQGQDNTLGQTAATFPSAPPAQTSSVKLSVLPAMLGGRPCAPPLTVLFRGETLRLEDSGQIEKQPAWLNTAADFDSGPP